MVRHHVNLHVFQTRSRLTTTGRLKLWKPYKKIKLQASCPQWNNICDQFIKEVEQAACKFMLSKHHEVLCKAHNTFRALSRSVLDSILSVMWLSLWLARQCGILYQPICMIQLSPRTLSNRDVTKLIKIRIRQMGILTFKIRPMWMRLVAFIL